MHELYKADIILSSCVQTTEDLRRTQTSEEMQTTLAPSEVLPNDFSACHLLRNCRHLHLT